MGLLHCSGSTQTLYTLPKDDSWYGLEMMDLVLLCTIVIIYEVRCPGRIYYTRHDPEPSNTFHTITKVYCVNKYDLKTKVA